jgi:hypothetical protein
MFQRHFSAFFRILLETSDAHPLQKLDTQEFLTDIKDEIDEAVAVGRV